MMRKERILANGSEKPKLGNVPHIMLVLKNAHGQQLALLLRKGSEIGL